MKANVAKVYFAAPSLRMIGLSARGVKAPVAKAVASANFVADTVGSMSGGRDSIVTHYREGASLDHQNRTGRQAHEAIRCSANNSLVERGMPHEADDQEIGFQTLEMADDRSGSMAADDFGLEAHAFALGAPAGVLRHDMDFGI